MRNFLPYRLEPVASQKSGKSPLNSVLDRFGDNLGDNLVNSLMDLTIIPVCCSLFGGWLIWQSLYCENDRHSALFLLTFCFAAAAFADLKNEIPTRGQQGLSETTKFTKNEVLRATTTGTEVAK